MSKKTLIIKIMWFNITNTRICSYTGSGFTVMVEVEKLDTKRFTFFVFNTTFRRLIFIKKLFEKCNAIILFAVRLAVCRFVSV